MEIIDEEVKTYYLTYKDTDGHGDAFPCDQDGQILWGAVYDPETTRKSLDFCQSHTDRWTGKNGEIVAFVYHSRYGICPSCGHRVYFGGSGWASHIGVGECDCERWYNIFGEEILPPEDWGDDY